MKSETKADVYETITARILEQLEKGVIPWRKPWASHGVMAQNYTTRKTYRGINAFILAVTPWDCPFFVTFKQAIDLGGNVRKGEKGTPIAFWNWVESKTEVDAKGKPKRIPFLRHYTAFNLEQCEGIAWEMPVKATNPDFSPIGEADRIANGMPNPPTVRHGGDRACYNRGTDHVQMPKADAFTSSDAYYHTLFHELTHATGHESRLARKDLAEIAAFGDAAYSREELVAEMGAAFLAASAGIDPAVEQSAAYVKGWLAAIKADSKLLVMAAGQAQKAADYILGAKQEANA